MLEYNDIRVKQTINITDFGHLTSDADEGEDKMTKGLRREGLAINMDNMMKLADTYTAQYMAAIEKLGVETDKISFPRASQYIDAQIALVKTLEEKGYAYEAEDGVYFDVRTFPRYGALGGINLETMKEGARVEVRSHKRHAADFVLWKKDPKMGWKSPWGMGFPGWHIECSAMARATLGEQIDIHGGGVEHAPIHHNNEIAQSEAATGKTFSRFWIHRAHVRIDGGKMAKSEGNVVYLDDLEEKGFSPLAFRYWLLTAHYRTPASFSWDALEASERAWKRLVEASKSSDAGTVPPTWKKRFKERINNDIDTPGAIAVLWDALKDKNLSTGDKRALLLDADRVLGIGLGKSMEKEVSETIPVEIQDLLRRREEARVSKDWSLADALREEMARSGFIVTDTVSGQNIRRK